MVTAGDAGSRSTRDQTASATKGGQEAHTKRMQSEDIKATWKKLEETYGQKQGRAASPIPYKEVAGLMRLVLEEYEKDASRRVDHATNVILKLAEKLEDRWKENTAPRSYAQAARRGNAGVEYGKMEVPPAVHPREEKRIVVKITSKEEAVALKEQSREEIASRIQQVAGVTQANHKVVAVQRLKSGDLAIHMDSSTAKKDLEKETSWVQSITPGAAVRTRTWPVLVHGVKVADFPPTAWEEHAKRMQSENARTHPGLRITKLRWLGQTVYKDFAPLLVEVATAEQANRLINEGVAIAYDLKMVERFDPKCRIIQCFKCQRYGHISTHCMNKQKCGHCGGIHTTDSCVDKAQATNKCCAACSGGQHASWSTACPARQRDTQRARTARRTMPRLFPVAARMSPTPIFSEIPTGSMRFPSVSQASSDGFSVVTAKKRKFGTPGRPVGAVNKAKTIERDVDTRTLNFVPQIDLRSASETPTSTQLSTDSEMEVKLTPSNQ